MNKDWKEATLFQALLPIIALIGLLVLNIKFIDYFGGDALNGANQIALIFASAIASVIAVRLGRNWQHVRRFIVKSIGSAMPSMLILFLIGSLSGTWVIGGIVPSLIYYGLHILNPTYFLVVSVIISAIISLATGSSWSTIATIGIALFGIGKALGIDEGLVAGAIISGAYFGDKISPLSDTTNLAPAMAGTDLFTHIYYMLYTTVPSLIITLIIFLIIGFNIESQASATNISEMITALESTFYISPVLFIVPIFLVFIIIKKMPPVPALFLGTIAGAIFAVIFQPQIIKEIANFNGNYALSSYIAVMKTMFGGISISTPNHFVSELLATKGMSGMLNTIWLILTAMVFSGVMESAGLLLTLANSIVKYAKSTGSLVASTISTSIFINTTASDQYISIVVPGRMYAKTYEKMGIKPEVLSRALEDGGTVTSVLVPWNTCGAVQSTVLGVPTLVYAPYTFFSIISPFMSILFAYLNIKIRRFTPEEREAIRIENEKNESNKD